MVTRLSAIASSSFFAHATMILTRQHGEARITPDGGGHAYSFAAINKHEDTAVFKAN